MRYLMILILVSMVAVLSCTPAPKAEAENGPIETSENLPLDAAYEPGTWIENWDMALKNSSRNRTHSFGKLHRIRLVQLVYPPFWRSVYKKRISSICR